MDGCPEIDRILNRSRMRSHLKTLIFNGSISTQVIYKRQAYILTNTCPFDSVIVGIAVSYTDNDSYRSYVDNENNNFLTLAKTIALHGSSNNTYTSRLELHISRHLQIFP